MLAAAVGYRRRLNAKAAPQTTVVGAALVDEQGAAAQRQVYLVALPHPQQSHDSEGAAQSLTGTPKKEKGDTGVQRAKPKGINTKCYQKWPWPLQKKLRPRIGK